jgi:hypothetical protein
MARRGGRDIGDADIADADIADADIGTQTSKSERPQAREGPERAIGYELAETQRPSTRAAGPSERAVPFAEMAGRGPPQRVADRIRSGQKFSVVSDIAAPMAPAEFLQ